VPAILKVLSAFPQKNNFFTLFYLGDRINYLPLKLVVKLLGNGFKKTKIKKPSKITAI